MNNLALPAMPLKRRACCAEPMAGGFTAEEARRMARVCKALGDPARVRLLSMIARQPTGEACICDLMGHVQLSQSTVSHHMKHLVEAGLVTREQRGKWAHYAVTPETLTLLNAVSAATASLLGFC